MRIPIRELPDYTPFPAIRLQLGVVHPQAARKAMSAGIQVLMDGCIMPDHMRLGA